MHWLSPVAGGAGVLTSCCGEERVVRLGKNAQQSDRLEFARGEGAHHRFDSAAGARQVTGRLPSSKKRSSVLMPPYALMAAGTARTPAWGTLTAGRAPPGRIDPQAPAVASPAVCHHGGAELGQLSGDAARERVRAGREIESFVDAVRRRGLLEGGRPVDMVVVSPAGGN